MCIYFGNSPELTYKNREHIFPAGLGGKQKLKKGIVSDQANALFSPMEMKMMRQSIIGLDRMLFGPGDRGSLEIGRASKSLVTVGRDDSGQPTLSYTSAGKPYIISQFRLSGNKIYISLQNEQKDISDNMSRFLDILRRFDNKFVYLMSPYLSDGDIIVGVSDGKYYVSTSDCRPGNDEVKKTIQLLLHQKNITCDNAAVIESKVEQKHDLMEDTEIARMYAKTAMNVFAFIKGEEYILNPKYDDIRNWIIRGESKEDYLYLPRIIPKNITRILPPDSHWCIFAKYESKLIAIVCFYNHIYRGFTLGDTSESGQAFPYGYICDWRNEKEYTLSQLTCPRFMYHLQL